MTNSKKPAYLILDLETTGTDPQQDYILEVGAILVDSDLNEIDRFHSLVKHGSDISEYSAVVQDMHTDNGLWLECQACTLTVRDVQDQILWWLQAHNAQGVQLAGASIHFDRAFIAADMIHLNEELHYRQVDITGVARELRACGVDVPEVKRAGHRAMTDCVFELDEWRKLRATVSALASFQAGEPRGSVVQLVPPRHELNAEELQRMGFLIAEREEPDCIIIEVYSKTRRLGVAYARDTGWRGRDVAFASLVRAARAENDSPEYHEVAAPRGNVAALLENELEGGVLYADNV